MADLIYRVTADVQGTRYGSRNGWCETQQALADAIAEDTRTTRPDLTGPLTIHIWTRRDDEHYRQPTPDDANRFEYPAV